MVDRKRASVIARRAAAGIPRTQHAAERAAANNQRVRISARIETCHRDALRQLGAAYGLSVSALMDLIGALAHQRQEVIERLVAERAEAFRRPWGGPRA